MRSCVTWLAAALATFAVSTPTASGATRSHVPPTTTTVVVPAPKVVVNTPRDDDNAEEPNATTVLTAAVTGILGLAGGAGTVVASNKKDKRRREDGERRDEAKEVDGLVDACQKVVSDLPNFGAGVATQDDIIRLAEDHQAVISARDKVKHHTALNVAANAFAKATNAVLEDPQHADLPAVTKISDAFEVVKTRSQEVKSALKRQ
jgi:hypothetical protein